MFEFYGVLSSECIQKISKRENLCAFLTTSIILLLLLSATIPLIIFKLDGYKEFIGFTIFLFIIDILILFCKPRSLTFKLSRKVTIDIENNKITREIEGYNKAGLKPKTRKISSIKKIIDYGDWYCIVFVMDPSDTIACQKNLMTKGTIQDFEETFKNKIINK